jgi:hypothetical protein
MILPTDPSVAMLTLVTNAEMAGLKHFDCHLRQFLRPRGFSATSSKNLLTHLEKSPQPSSAFTATERGAWQPHISKGLT